MSAHWRQYTITFPDPDSAQQVMAHEIGPVLSAAQAAGHVRLWWFLRKHSWRVRYLPGEPGYAAIDSLLDALADAGLILRWMPGVYEPETVAFGGRLGMKVAHELFHHDSRYVLFRAATPTVPPLGMRETTVVLCSAMMRGAGLDRYEQGDVWAKVAALRPKERSTAPPGRDASLQEAMHRLMTVDAHALCNSVDGALAGYEGWITAFEQTGRTLAGQAHQGRLDRGLRAVLAHHVIFHANRAALSVIDQSTMAALAVDTVFGASGDVTFPFAAHPITKVARMTHLTTISDNTSAERLRGVLTDRLCSQGIISDPAVEAAFRRIPRELFVPGVPLDQVYDDNAVYTKTSASGAWLSAASQPRIVAMMLHQLAARPGMRVLEAGAGTGVNAAYLADLVGECGHVVTIDVDADLVDGARNHLVAAGVTNVEVVLGDGALGHPAEAPYDRVIATVGAFEVPAAWLKQLTPEGRLVVPLRLRGAAARSIAFERAKDCWRSVGSELAIFMPLRGGIGDDTQRAVALTPAAEVALVSRKDQTVADQALAGVLETDRHEIWTGVFFPPMTSFEWMDLWLACTLDNSLMRMNVQAPAIERGLVSPMFEWGAMATTRDADLAYLTIRPATPSPVNGGKLYEVGVVGHGPTGHDLAELVGEQIRTWDANYRERSVRFELPDSPATADPAVGRFVLERPRHPITVIWE
ncbi:methyltransferase, FxLD system [Streptosporangium sp. NPDC023615]|uniref:methyltransferase, FxLD system n=1 Tax=Streptosporangium sp. NPDC023615 TaxID=3154794 RepID=UPI0034357BD5